MKAAPPETRGSPPWDPCAFAYRAAHDLRGPLARIHAFATLLEEDLADRLGPEDVRALEIVSRSAERAAGLVGRLLEVALVVERPLEVRELDVRAVAGAAIDALAPTALGLGARFRLGELGRVEADPDLLGTLFRELLANALAAAEPGRAPRIALVAELGADGRAARLGVVDDGVGIAPERRATMLAPFETGPGGADRDGLGLALCRVACERHGWRLEVRGGAGSTELRIALG